MKICVLSKLSLFPLNMSGHHVSRLSLTLTRSTQTKRISYRVQDFVEVHKTDGDRDGLEEDCCE